MAPASAKAQIIVSGKLSDDKFQRCKRVVENVSGKTDSYTFQVNALLPTDYELYIQQELQHVEAARKHKAAVLVLLATAEAGKLKTQYIGGEEEFLKWVSNTLAFTDQANGLIYRQLARAAMKNFCVSTNRQYLYMHLTSKTERLGSLLIELFTDVCPQTCDNFLQLALGAHKAWSYKGTPLHRVVAGAFVQGGDVVNGSGRGNPEYTIPDESFAVKHDRAGILAMANLSVAHSASTQFYITLAPLPWLDGKRVAFGRVIDGMRTLRVLEKVELENERPVDPVMIAGCELMDPAAGGKES